METATTTTISFATLPALGADLEGGAFAGVITSKNGTHCAVVLLPDQGTDLKWKAATEWAAGLQAELPTRPVAALLFANLRNKLRREWHWTSETHELDESYAWYCYFRSGGQDVHHKSYEGAAVAVRLIPLSA